jgi:polar amino acid transport system permease protein/cystine transport system permease protein
MRFNGDVFLDALPAIAAAALINMRLALTIFVFALAGGLALTIVRAQKVRVVNGAISLLISFIRGTPLVVQIFLCFYALPALGLNLSAMQAGVLAIALNSACFVTEIMRGGLRTIDVGQIEASTALGLSPVHIWRFVVIPQLLRRTLPMLVNEGTIVVKGTALLSVITVVEALRVAQQIGAGTFRPFEPLVAAALMFLAINLALTGVAALMERRFAVARA